MGTGGRLPFTDIGIGRHRKREPAVATSATVLDSILEGVRDDVAAREAIVSMAAVKAAAEAAPPPLDAIAGLAGARHRGDC